MENSSQRRLAAILAADVVGYSRLMGLDEAGTLAAVQQLLAEVIGPKIVEHHGRLFKAMGDGFLVEFPSVVNAVACAVAIQKAIAVRNADLPEGQQIDLRIGVHLGDVIAEGGDLFGDGVNIAARLESLAPTGGVAISAMVRDNIGSRLDLGFEDMGEQKLKNIAGPLRVYRLAASRPAAQANRLEPSKPSIAVLPFTNMSGDVEQQFFSDGITKDVITELSRFRQIRVVARNMPSHLREADHDLSRLGRELGVAYLVDGSVRKINRRVRINVQLIEIGSNNHLWADKFDRDQEEIFSIQDQMVQTIVATIVGQLQTAMVEASRRTPPANLAAYECVLRADSLPYGDVGSETEARALLERAIALDPSYPRAYAAMANSYRLEWSRDMSGKNHLLDLALGFAQKAVVLDENSDVCHEDLGWVLLCRYAYDLAEYHFQKALYLNSNRPGNVANFGSLYAYLGKPDDALQYFERARSLDPYFEPSWYWRMLGIALFVARRHSDAIISFEKSPIVPFWVHGYLAACHAHIGLINEARYHASETLRLAPDFSIVRAVSKDPFKRTSDRQHLIDGMRSAGLPE